MITTRLKPEMSSYEYIYLRPINTRWDCLRRDGKRACRPPISLLVLRLLPTVTVGSRVTHSYHTDDSKASE